MEYTEVLYNNSYGIFRLPLQICEQYRITYRDSIEPFMTGGSVTRCNRRLVKLYKESEFYTLKKCPIRIARVPQGCLWEIHEYDGLERVNWNLPKDSMIDELVLLNTGSVSYDNLSKFTKMLLDSGKSLHDFEIEFRKKFTEITNDAY